MAKEFFVQESRLVSTIPLRPKGVFSLADDEGFKENMVLEKALDLLHYLMCSDVFLRCFSYFTLPYDSFQGSIQTFSFEESVAASHVGKVKEFLQSQDFPKLVALNENLDSSSPEPEGCACFHPQHPDSIFIDSGFLKAAKQCEESDQVKFAFLLFTKLAHEMAHYISHFLLKNEDGSLLTPNALGEESGNYFEGLFLGYVVGHHYYDVSNIWSVDVVLFERASAPVGSKHGYAVPLDYMKSLFQKDFIDAAQRTADFNCASSIIITSPSLARARIASRDITLPTTQGRSIDKVFRSKGCVFRGIK